MSHIPASAMPHAKPHDEHGEGGEHEQNGAKPDVGTTSAEQAPAPTAAPEIKPAGSAEASPQGDAAKPEQPAAEKLAEAAKSTGSLVALAAVGALAIGGIVAALALRRSAETPEPSRKAGKGKRKGRDRKDHQEA